MRAYYLIGLVFLGACREAASNESANAAEARPAIEPIALTVFERGATATIQRARSERQARNIESRARRAFETYLRDPFSVRFRNLRSGRNGAICGQANAKNAMGAYVGFKDFVVGRDGRRIWMSDYVDGIDSDLLSDFAEAYANACANASDRRRYQAAHTPYYPDYYGTDDSNAVSNASY